MVCTLRDVAEWLRENGAKLLGDCEDPSEAGYYLVARYNPGRGAARITLKLLCGQTSISEVELAPSRSGCAPRYNWKRGKGRGSRPSKVVIEALARELESISDFIDYDAAVGICRVRSGAARPSYMQVAWRDRRGDGASCTRIVNIECAGSGGVEIKVVSAGVDGCAARLRAIVESIVKHRARIIDYVAEATRIAEILYVTLKEKVFHAYRRIGAAKRIPRAIEGEHGGVKYRIAFKRENIYVDAALEGRESNTMYSLGVAIWHGGMIKEFVFFNIVSAGAPTHVQREANPAIDTARDIRVALEAVEDGIRDALSSIIRDMYTYLVTRV